MTNGEPFLGKNPEKVFITNSEIQTYKDCKRKWWLQYYRALKPKDKSYLGPLPLGVRIHSALEYYYTTGDNPVDQYNRLANADARAFMDTPDAAFDEKVKKFNSENDLGRIMLEGYMDWMSEENPDAELKVVAPEMKLSHTLEEDPRVTIMGKTDMKVKRASSGATAILDFKSAQTFSMYYETAHMSEQLMLYIMLERLDPKGFGKVDGGIYRLLKKVKRTGTAKPPFYEDLNVRFNDTQLKNFWDRTVAVVLDIMKTRDSLDSGVSHQIAAYPSPTRDCTWKCPFFKMCTMLDDGSMAEEFLKDFYEPVDPNARYEEESIESF